MGNKKQKGIYMETIQEVLTSGDLPSALRPALVDTEVIEGARAALIAQQMVRVDRRLVGSAGISIEVPKSTHLSTGDFTDGTTDMTSPSHSDKSITHETVTIDKHKYSTYALSKTFLENQPDIAWIRLGFTNMGKALQEQIDSDILSTLISGVTADSKVDAGQNALTYNDINDAENKLDAVNFKLGYIVIHPNEYADLRADSSGSMLDIMQYTDPSIALNGEVGRVLGAPVLKTTQMTAGSVLLVADKNHLNGPVAWIAFKRDINVEPHEEPGKEEMYWFTTARYGVKVTQPSGLALITGVV